MSKAQRETGDRDDVLATITEAVEIYRNLVQENPAAWLPDLALSLNNLSLQQAEAGDLAGALASVIEAVDIRRELVRDNPDAFLPALADSLKVLSLYQAEAGDRDGAMDTITEAVGYYRELAQADFNAFLPALADSLKVLSLYQAEAGDRDGAMDTITEAVGYYRELAQADPDTFRPELAMLLNNLSNARVEAGDGAGALDTITEAVGYYRELAQADFNAFLPALATALNILSLCQAGVRNRIGALGTIIEAVGYYQELAQADPKTFLPDLALSLHNLSNRLGQVWDWDGALINITEAVNIRRGLAQANPDRFLPYLAGSLNNLSAYQTATGDRTGALATITEAVAIFRSLAEADPAAFLPRLIAALTNLSERLSDNGNTRAIAKAWRVAIEGMADLAPRAELRAAWAARLLDSGFARKARKELRCAAEEADRIPADESAIRIAMITRARLAVRSAVQAHGHVDGDLPVWATAPIPTAHVELVNAVGQASDWPALHAALDRHRDVLGSPQLRVSLHALAGLYPNNPAPSLLLGLLDEIDASGLDALIHRRQQAHERRALLDAWIDTPTWEESLEFFRQYQPELTTDESRQTLAGMSNDDTVRQHLAILDLALMTSVDDAYAIVTDPAAAEDAAFAAIEDGDLPLMVAIADAAADALEDRPTTWGLLVAILLLAEDDEDSACAHMRQVAEQGSPILRRAHAIRLRALQHHHPDLPGLDRLIDIIKVEGAQ
ncbi:MAG: hypothetical protein ACRD0K_15970 [Egibacteraceae bacterium]